MNILILILVFFCSLNMNTFSDDECGPIKEIPKIKALVEQKGGEYCPGACQTHYKIPKQDKQNIWYRGNCFRIVNKSNIYPIFIPAKNLELYSPGGVGKFHADLKCVGDFYHTKEDNARKECKRTLEVKIDECPNPRVVEEIEAMCDPGCSYEEMDKSQNPPVLVTKYKGGNGSPCTYYKKIKLVWDGISGHEPNNSSEVIVQKTYIIDEAFDRIACVKPVVTCESLSKKKWEGGNPGGGPGVPPAVGRPEKSGETSVSP